jgi:tryptophan synthase alpha subunit
LSTDFVPKAAQIKHSIHVPHYLTSYASGGVMLQVSLTGVTGTRVALQDRVEGLLKDIKKVSSSGLFIVVGSFLRNGG